MEFANKLDKLNIEKLLDDVAVMTKVAAKKTTGVLGDDLALNAQQVSGVAADRAPIRRAGESPGRRFCFVRP